MGLIIENEWVDRRIGHSSLFKSTSEDGQLQTPSLLCPAIGFATSFSGFQIQLNHILQGHLQVPLQINGVLRCNIFGQRKVPHSRNVANLAPKWTLHSWLFLEKKTPQKKKTNSRIRFVPNPPTLVQQVSMNSRSGSVQLSLSKGWQLVKTCSWAQMLLKYAEIDQ